jgi:hypothetical protein
MGDRWVVPPTHTRVGEGPECIVEAKATGLDAAGKSVQISPLWIPADPDMVTVSPAQGSAVKITVQHAGETSLEVASQGFSKRLPIHAVEYGETILVELSQY